MLIACDNKKLNQLFSESPSENNSGLTKISNPMLCPDQRTFVRATAMASQIQWQSRCEQFR